MQSAALVIPSVFNVQSDTFLGMWSLLGKKSTFMRDNMYLYPVASIKSTLFSTENVTGKRTKHLMSHEGRNMTLNHADVV